MNRLEENRKAIFDQALEDYKLNVKYKKWENFSEEQLKILADQVADEPCPTTYTWTNPLDNSDGALDDNDGGIFGSEDKGYSGAFNAFIEETEKDLTGVL